MLSSVGWPVWREVQVRHLKKATNNLHFLSSLYPHCRNRAEISPTVHFSEQYHLFWCHFRQGHRQQTGKSKQCLQQALEKNIEEQALEDLHKEQCLRSCGRDHPPVHLWVMGTIQSPTVMVWTGALPLTMPRHHPQHLLESFYYKYGSSSSGRGPIVEVTAALAWTFSMNAESSPARGCTVWRTLLWPLKHLSHWNRWNLLSRVRFSRKVLFECRYESKIGAIWQKIYIYGSQNTF